MNTIIQYRTSTIQGKRHVSWGFKGQPMYARYKEINSDAELESFLVGIVEGLNLASFEVDKIEEIE